MTHPDADHDSVATGPLVLVIEDDPTVRLLIESVLNESGFEVITARDGLEGLLKLRMLQPSAIVLDIMMPDVGGLRVLDELGERATPIPVVVVTGKPEAAVEARRRLGATNVFEKPFDPDALVQRVRTITGVTNE